MLEMQKSVLQKVSFDKALFRKELIKTLRWIKKEERLLLKAWCVATFSPLYNDIIHEVFDHAMSS